MSTLEKGIWMTQTYSASELERSQGCLLGLAVADAIGTTVEFKPKGSFPLMKTIEGGGVFELPVGAWTDDTSMALCLGHSLIECGKFDPKDQLQRYYNWWKKGYMSSIGHCFDIGGTTQRALDRFRATGKTDAEDRGERGSGNGSIMRLAPVPIWTAKENIDVCINFSERSSITTHASEYCLESCRLLGFILHSLINGKSKAEAINYPYADKLECVAIKELVNMVPEELDYNYGSNGFVVTTLEAALWAFLTTDNFKDAVLKAVNLGDDADTIGAVCGQLAGAYYGVDAIPKEWIDKLYQADMIKDVATKLFIKGDTE